MELLTSLKLNSIWKRIQNTKRGKNLAKRWLFRQFSEYYLLCTRLDDVHILATNRFLNFHHSFLVGFLKGWTFSQFHIQMSEKYQKNIEMVIRSESKTYTATDLASSGWELPLKIMLPRWSILNLWKYCKFCFQAKNANWFFKFCTFQFQSKCREKFVKSSDEIVFPYVLDADNLIWRENRWKITM